MLTLREMTVTIENQFNIHPSAYIAPSARIYGNVTIGANSSVWDGVTIRGDVAPIRIGSYTNLQENVIVHVDEGIPTHIGNHVTVGHGAIVHGAEVADYCIIGIKATVLSGAQIGTFSIVGACALVPENKVIPHHTLVFGIPCRPAKTVSENLEMKIRQNSQTYVDLSRLYMAKHQIPKDRQT